jgi:hypothetical protein
VLTVLQPDCQPATPAPLADKIGKHTGTHTQDFSSFPLKMATNPTGKNSFSEAIAVQKKNAKNLQSINTKYW